ncbi:DUF6875 domain-containing protein [Nonomuraea sp. NPDC049141]|uniref:DUF6875 domain-containing protein n=1 Tax=unclassified Nonomuraea TaxID=2593643 RepID=UPI0033D9DB90
MRQPVPDPRPVRAEPGEADACGVAGTWVREYLCRPHPELGRSGPVCPYARRALDRGMVWAVTWPDCPADATAMTAIMAECLHWFERSTDPDQALLVLFPRLTAADHGLTIEGVQRRLKPAFVRRGLMIGEFHDGPPDVPGLHNPWFRPLRSPVPLLAVRHMVHSDLPFLQGDPEHLAAYRRFFPLRSSR